MGKSSQRRLMRQKKDRVGCIGGLISIFDFQNGRATQKLLSVNRRDDSDAKDSGHSRSRTQNTVDSDGRCQGGNDNEDRTVVKTGADKPPSVKKLIQQELHSEPDSKKQESESEIDEKQLSSERGGHIRKKKKKINKGFRKSRNFHNHDLNSVENGVAGISQQEKLEQVCKGHLNVNVVIDELCSQIHQNELAGANESVSEEKLSEAAEVFINQKFFSGKNSQDKEFVDAVKTFNSNKELLHKLLQDPNSLLVRNVQSLLESHRVEKDEIPKSEENVSSPLEVGIRKQHGFFRKRNKSSEKNPPLASATPQDSNKIVILKPGPLSLQNSEMETTLASPFSLTEIKRKFKRAVAKDWHRSSSENCNLKGSEKGIGGGELLGMNSPTRDHFFKEKFPRTSFSAKNKDKVGMQKEFLELGTSGSPDKKVLSIYAEARKHISEMLNNGNENLEASNRTNPEALGRILSLVERNHSPISSQKDSEEVIRDNKVERTLYSGNEMCSEVQVEIIEATSSVQEENNGLDDYSGQRIPIIIGNMQNEKVESPSLNQNISDEAIRDNEAALSSVRHELCNEVDVEIKEVTNSLIHKEINVLDASSEPISSCITRDEQIDDAAQFFDDQTSCQSSILELTEENQPSCSPSSSRSSSLTSKEIEHLESITDRPERPSPVSVLDPLFADDETSPMARSKVELPIQPLEIQFEEQESNGEDQGHHVKTRTVDKETVSEYVKAVLQASNLSWDNILMSSPTSDQLLELSLFQETGLFPNQHCHDQKLLFDCINEVLVEVSKRYHACAPWLSFVKPNVRPVPNSQNVISEVWEGVDWHLIPVPSPCTMDQILRKDMAKSGTWMDLRADIEAIGVEMGEAIIEELIEDTIWSCVDGSQEHGFPAASVK